MTSIQGSSAARSAAAYDTLTDPLLALSEHEIEADDSMYKSDREAQLEARVAKASAEDRAVTEMQNKADDIKQGGLLSGACVIGGGLLEISGAEASKEETVLGRRLTAGGKSLAELSGSVGKLEGDAPAQMDDARAQRARNEAEQDGWAADDAGDRSKKIDKQSDAALDTLQSILQARREATNAILSKV